jgi:5-methylcytosine-specific restriction endonuclease McrA
MNVLDNAVLVLNKHWQPLRTATVQEVLGLVAKGSAKIIDHETYEVYDLMSWNDVSKAKAKFDGCVIRSARMALLAPEVVLLTGYDGIGARGVVFSRKNLFKRDKFTCQYCGAQPGPSELTIDHVNPKSKGGRSVWDNCVLACVECNSKKANLPLEKSGLKLRKIPKKPTWKMLTYVSIRKMSWEKFLDKAYWEVELEP